MNLRPYQQAAIQNLRLSLASGKTRPVLQAATGAGKTVMASTIIQSAVDKGHRVLFVVDNLELVQQAIDTFESQGLKVGVMQGIHEKTDSRFKVQVCTAQTLAARIKNKPMMWGPENYQIGLIICDEAHVQWKSRDMLANLYPDVPVVGLSATPFAKGMGKFYDDLVVAIPMQELIDTGFLSPFRVFAPSSPDMTGVATKSNGDWQESGAAERYTPKIIADVVRTWFLHGRGRSTIGFACNVAHSKQLTKEFQANGINAEHIDGYGGDDESKEHRRDVIARFKRGEIDVLWNVGIATKGFDAPIVSCIIDARPTKSLMLHVQKWGRGLRIADGKTECIILDHAGNCERNGFPTDLMPEQLDDGTKGNAQSLDRKKKDDPLPKPCPACSFMKQPMVHICPACGFAPEKKANVETVDGELVEVGGKKFTKKDRRRWFSELLHVAYAKGYQQGWAFHKYREKFKENPPKRVGVSESISADVESYVRHLNIKYAKGKAKKQESANAA